MRILIAGLGTQGKKRKIVADIECVATVDPMNPDADYQSIYDIPTDRYDTVFICVPEEEKIELIRYAVKYSKHVLVEKPLLSPNFHAIKEIESESRKAGVTIYSAYNHRFEPHIEAVANLIESGRLGNIYSCRLFYGNGTATLVRNSTWRDKGKGVLSDLGPHLLDIVRFWFGDIRAPFKLISCNRFENKAPDHAILLSEANMPRIELEMTLVSWKNHFTCDLFGEYGSVHIRSLCKWGPAKLTVHWRVFPGGPPKEEIETLTQEDPTWEKEHQHFKSLCIKNHKTDLSSDLWILQTINRSSNGGTSAC